MVRNKRTKYCGFLILLIIFQFFLIEIDLSYNYINNKKEDYNFFLIDSEEKQKNENINSTKVKTNVIDDALKSYSENCSLNQKINIIIESNSNQLSECLSIFKEYGEIDKIINSSYFSGFSAIIANRNLKMLIEKLPNSINLIKRNEKAKITLKDSLKQLRIFPYIRNNFKLKGDKNTSIAILDAGVDGTHPSLKNKIIFWKDFFNTNFNNATDYRAHGTAIASIACGNPYNTTDNFGRTIISERYYYDWSGYSFNLSATYRYVSNALNLTTNGNLAIEGNWFAKPQSTINILAFQLINSSGVVVKQINTPNKDQKYSLNYNINETNYGIYSIQHIFNLSSESYPAYGINMSIYIPENNSNLENSYSGIAPNCNIVALRCVGEGADEDEIISAMNWVLNHKKEYNITSVIMGFKINSVTIRNLADDMVEAGLVVSCAAGNDGPYNIFHSPTNFAGSAANAPGCADKVLSVGAINYNSSLTSYSSRGGWNPTKHVKKPDILAPGGVRNDYTYKNTPIYCADSNFGEYLSFNFTKDYEDMRDIIKNDSRGVSGTSFAAPFVAGVAQLIIEAMGGINFWKNYTEQNSLFVKNLLMLTATETFPNKRLGYPEQSPGLQRGDKDVHEGYGKINPDAAIDAVMYEINVNATYSSFLASIPTNKEFKQYCWARKIYLPRNFYNITLQVPNNADFDLYIYNYFGNQYGEPIIRKKSINSSLGADEKIIDFAPPKDGYYFVVIKGVNGSGVFNLSFFKSPKHFDKIPPVSYLLLPYDNSVLNETILIKGNASDDYSGIKNATITIETPKRQIFFPFTSPLTEFSTLWTSKKRDNGLCSIYITVYDNFNNSAISNIVYITIFNDDVPPIIEWIKPEDKATYYGPVDIKVKIIDEHSRVKNATIIIDTPRSYYVYETSDFQEILKYTWTPLLKDDGSCFIDIKAYDNNNNLGYSTTILVILRYKQYIFNTFLLFSVIFLLGYIMTNRTAKRLLTSEKFERYLNNLSIFLKKPSREGFSKISLFKLLKKEDVILKEINIINDLIVKKQFNKALLICNYMLEHQLKQKRIDASNEFIRLINDLKIDINKKLEKNIKKIK
ncbi:MAG: S8 family peptidase [Promethearchaeota archaeon]